MVRTSSQRRRRRCLYNNSNRAGTWWVPESDALESIATIGQGNECDKHSEFYLREPLCPWRSLFHMLCHAIWSFGFFTHSHCIWTTLIAILPLIPALCTILALQTDNREKQFMSTIMFSIFSSPPRLCTSWFSVEFSRMRMACRWHWFCSFSLHLRWAFGPLPLRLAQRRRKEPELCNHLCNGGATMAAN